MSDIKVYIGCCKPDFYLLKSCIASIRYWNREVPVYLLKDLSGGMFNTDELEKVFNVRKVETRYKKLGGYMKLQPYIEHPDERIFLQDADMVWLGDMVQVLNGFEEDIVVDAYNPPDVEAELNRWYFNTSNLRRHYPTYQYPGFVFNCGSILFRSSIFQQQDFKDIMLWQEKGQPLHPGVFLCEDQGIINYIVAEKYLNKAISLARVHLQVPSDSEEASHYDLDKIRANIPSHIIVHWLGRKVGLNGFCPARHLLRFYEKQFYQQLRNGSTKMAIGRLARTLQHFDKFIYEQGKKFYYAVAPQK